MFWEGLNIFILRSFISSSFAYDVSIVGNIVYHLLVVMKLKHADCLKNISIIYYKMIK